MVDGGVISPGIDGEVDPKSLPDIFGVPEVETTEGESTAAVESDEQRKAKGLLVFFGELRAAELSTQDVRWRWTVLCWVNSRLPLGAVDLSLGAFADSEAECSGSVADVAR